VKAVAEEMGIGFLGIGFQPKWALKDIPIMPKVVFYDILFFSSICCFHLVPRSYNYIIMANRVGMTS
jgi:hypothetical protein